MLTKRSGSRETRSKRGNASSKSGGQSSSSVVSDASRGKKGRTFKTQRKKKITTTATPFTAEFFPLPSGSAYSHEHSLRARSSAANFVGVCFSGGGSRALSAAMGQLRGLKYLNLLDEVFFISSVSGGTWASAAYTYLPPQYDDDDFLGLVVVNPGDLELGSNPEYGLDYLSPNNLGNVPPTLGFLHDIEIILELKEKYGYPNSDLWQGLVGWLILRRWGLWNVDARGLPTRYYSFTPAYLGWKGGILDRNRQLKASQFYCVQRQRPLYVMNGCLVSNPEPGAQLLYFESTPVGLGVRNYFPAVMPCERAIGGGLLEPFAMGSVWEKDISVRYASVSATSRPFSLSDMVSISSAAFAETIQKDHPEFDGLIPTYPYWPVKGRQKNPAYPYQFADGGSLEDTGITSLLNRNLPNVIAFVNSQTPLTKDDSGQIVVDSQIQLLFGIQPSAASLKYKEAKRRDVPNDDVTFTQVFDSARYDELAQGLWAANSDPYNGTAMYMQTLPVLPNANFGIQGNYNVRVLWIYNTWVGAWYDLLSDEVGIFAKGEEDVLNFPNFDTIAQLELSARQVNLLAQLSCWNVMSNTHVGPQGKTNAQMVTAIFFD